MRAAWWIRWGVTGFWVVNGILVWSNFVQAVRSDTWPRHGLVSLGLLALVFPLGLSAQWLRSRHPRRAYVLLAVASGLIFASLTVLLWWGHTPL